jgi:hypothetical protein
MYSKSNQNTSACCVSGRSLAAMVARRKPAERAIIAALLVEGQITLVDLTVKTIVKLCGASEPYVDAARRPNTRSAPMAGWPYASSGRMLMSKKPSSRAMKALSELEALAKSRAAERSAAPKSKPKLPTADRISAIAKDFITVSVRQ